MGIMQSVKRTAMNFFAGDNLLLRNLILDEYNGGHRFKALALAVMTSPFRSSIKASTDETFNISKDYYSELLKLLHISKVEGFNLVRTGQHNDGGYIMLDDFHDGGTAYSFGINNDVSWDKDMVSRGYDIFMYDHTIDGLPEENPHFHWSKLGIADGVTHDDRLKTLDELIRANHHENTHDMLLKMDVEGAEWGFFEQVSSEMLSQFGQMTFEFHDIITHDNPELVLSVFRKINQTHQLIHVHANNCNSYITLGNKTVCDALELTYVLRSKYSFIDDYDVNLPISIDEVNRPFLPEIELGRWNEDIAGDILNVRVKVV